MSRFPAAIVLTLAATLPFQAPGYSIGLSANLSKTEIECNKVDITLMQPCSNGRGYSGTAELTCNGHTETQPLGADGPMLQTVVFEDVAKLFNLAPGNHTFTGKATLVGCGRTIEATASIEVDFCLWESLAVESKCEGGKPWHIITLDESENYTHAADKPDFSAACGGGTNLTGNGSLTLDRTLFPKNEPIGVTIADESWFSKKGFKVSNDYDEDDTPLPGKATPALGSMVFTLPVAVIPGRIGRNVLSLRCQADEWSPALLTRAAMEIDSRNANGHALVVDVSGRTQAWTAVRNGDGLVQLQYPNGFTDLTNYPSGGYGVTGYTFTVPPPLSTNDLCYLAAPDQPVAFHYDFLPREPEAVVLGGAAATNNGVVVTGWLAGGATNMWEFVHAIDPDDEDGAFDWQLVSQGLVRESRTTTRLSADLRATRSRAFPARGGKAVADTLTIERNFPWGWTRVAEVVDPDGLALSNSWTYAEEGAGSYGRLVSETDEYGATTTYEYDARGRTVATTSPTPMGPRCKEYSYAAIDPRENAQSPASPHEARTTTESIAGVVVARTWKAVFENGDTRTTVTERAASQSAAYGDPGNLRDESVAYRPSASLGRLAGRPVRRLSHDGTLTTYAYSSGTLSAPDGTGFRTFTVAAGGPCLRVAALRTAASAPAGIPNQSTVSVSVYDALDNEVYAETRVVTGAGTSEPVSWKTSSYDAAGRLVSTLASDGSAEDFVHGEHGVVRSCDAGGFLTETVYDALGRAVRESRTTGYNGPKATETAYDAAGRVVSSRLSAGGLSQTSTNAYDLAGREVFARTPDGQETLTSYGHIPGTPFFYTETVSRPCAALAADQDAWASTNRSVRYKCGVAAWTEFNGERRTTYAYGLNPDGTQWTKTFTGPEGTNSPVWTLSVSDFLGGASGCGGSGSRVVAESRPAFGGGTLETRSEYDAFGRLAATRTYHVGPTGAETLVSATRHAYDALGSRVLTISDADGDGLFALDGSDAATSNATRYVRIGGDWWRESTAYSFPVAGSAGAVPVSRTRERLTGLGGFFPFGMCRLQSETRTATFPSAGETVVYAGVFREERYAMRVVETPDSAGQSYSYIVGGLPEIEISASGVTTMRTYDALDRVATFTDGSGHATSYAYDAYGRMASSTDSANETTTYAYDPLGRRTAVTDPLGNVTRTAYDAEGRVVAQWGATYPVLYSYDAYGRLSSLSTTRDPAANLSTFQPFNFSTGRTSIPWDTTEWRYDDASGLLTNKLYADGLGPSYAYTPNGRLATRLWARGIVTSNSYDFAGNLTNVVHSGGNSSLVTRHSSLFSYDRMGRMRSAIVDGVSTNHYFYSVHGQLTNEVQNGVSIARSYDALNRPTGYAYHPTTSPLHHFTTSYSYDAYGRFSSVAFGAGSLPGERRFDYSYNPYTGLLEGCASGAFSRQLYRDGSHDDITIFDNKYENDIVSSHYYDYDAARRRTAATRFGSAYGPLEGVTDVYGYNARSEVVQARRMVGNEVIRGFNFDYAYDPIGNRVTSTYYDEQGDARTSAYSANELNQYTQRTVPGNVQVRGEADAEAIVTVNGNPTWRYGFFGGETYTSYFYGGDDADNDGFPVFKDVAVEAVLPAPEPGLPDETCAVTGRVFVAASPEQFTYDADGNMTSDGRFLYTWNAENRLVLAQELCAPSNRFPYTVSYAYDHKGRMVSKRITENDGSDTLVKAVSYLWDGWNIIREIQWPVASGQWPVVTDNVWGLDLDGTLQGAGGVGGLLAVVRSDCAATNSSLFTLHSSLYFPTYDANGNITEYVTTNGEIVAHYDYSPFGEILVQSGDFADTFTHRFSTKPWCPITGLYEYQMRKYKPETGRWLNRDPIGECGGIDLYAFCLNSPILRSDHLGEKSEAPIPVEFDFDAWFLTRHGVTEIKQQCGSLRIINKKCEIIKLIFRMSPKIGYPPEVGPPARMPIKTNPLGKGMIANHSYPLQNATGISESELFGPASVARNEKTSTGTYPVLRYENARFNIGKEWKRWGKYGVSEDFSEQGLFTTWSTMWHQTAQSDGSHSVNDVECGEVVHFKMGNVAKFDFDLQVKVVAGDKE